MWRFGSDLKSLVYCTLARAAKDALISTVLFQSMAELRTHDCGIRERYLVVEFTKPNEDESAPGCLQLDLVTRPF